MAGNQPIKSTQSLQLTRKIIMAFIVEKMTMEDESFVYSEKNNLIIKKFGSTRKSESNITTDHWVIDRERNFYFLCLNNMEVMYNENNYLLIISGELVVIHVPREWAPLVKILYLPDTLKQRIKDIQTLILEAFEIGGYFCMGISNEVVDSVFPKFEQLNEEK